MPDPVIPPLPTFAPRPALLACPPPQPGMLVCVVPPVTLRGAVPFVGLILCVTTPVNGVVTFATPMGGLAVPKQAWPPDEVAEVYASSGAVLWRRVVPAEGGEG